MKINKKIFFIIVFVLFMISFFMEINKNCLKKNKIVKDNNSVKSILSANISIVGVEIKEDIKGYSAGASGVIIGKKDNTYYAITAYHVVVNKDYCLAVTVFDKSLKEFREINKTKKTDVNSYYNHLSKIKILYKCEKSDLAIISFKSEKQLEVASFSSDSICKGEPIVVIGNYEGELFKESYGEIISSYMYKFKTSDNQHENEVIRHTAYLAPGCSGGGVYNEKMELIGINIGAGTNIFGKFKYGAMIPNEQINDCINLWKEKANIFM